MKMDLISFDFDCFVEDGINMDFELIQHETCNSGGKIDKEI